MRAKCRTCGGTSDVAIDREGGLPAFTCAACGKRNDATPGHFFTVPEAATAPPDAVAKTPANAPNDAAPVAAFAPDPDAEQTSHRRDLRDLAEQTRSSLLPPPPAPDFHLEATPSVRAAILGAPALMSPAMRASLVAIAPPRATTPPTVVEVQVPNLRASPRRRALVVIGAVAGCAGALALALAFSSTPEPPSPRDRAAGPAEVASSQPMSCAVGTPGIEPFAAETQDKPKDKPAPIVTAPQKRTLVLRNPQPIGGGAIKERAPDKPAAPGDKPAAPADPAARPDLMRAIEGAVTGQGSAPPPSPAPIDLPSFDRGAALSALNSVAGSVSYCKPGEGEGGRGGVTVTFAPSGNASAVLLDPGPLAGTEAGRCVVRLFRGARVPAFSGAPVTLHRNFIVN